MKIKTRNKVIITVVYTVIIIVGLIHCYNSGGMDYMMDKLPWAIMGIAGMINTMANVLE